MDKSADSTPEGGCLSRDKLSALKLLLVKTFVAFNALRCAFPRLRANVNGA
jgi:hypothetical protein